MIRPLHMQRLSIAGFSLLESLIALVVLSIGLIGVASLHVQGLQFGQQALINSRAIGLASDMADRVRANATALVAYATPRGGPGAEPSPACADTPGNTLTDDCDPTAMAVYDIWQWKDAIASTNGLQSGEGQIEFDASTAVPRYTISVYWNERGEERNYTMMIQP